MITAVAKKNVLSRIFMNPGRINRMVLFYQHPPPAAISPFGIVRRNQKTRLPRDKLEIKSLRLLNQLFGVNP